MLTAADAKIRTEDSINTYINDVMKTIEQRVKECISKGEYSITMGYLKQSVIDKLEELGYTVKSSSQYNETYTCISWK